MKLIGCLNTYYFFYKIFSFIIQVNVNFLTIEFWQNQRNQRNQNTDKNKKLKLYIETLYWLQFNNLISLQVVSYILNTDCEFQWLMRWYFYLFLFETF